MTSWGLVLSHVILSAAKNLCPRDETLRSAQSDHRWGMEILIRLDEPAWRLVGRKQLNVRLDGETGTVADVIGELTKRFAGLGAELRGQTGDFIPYSLFLNDESVRWKDIDRACVKDGDRLRVILPIAGG